MKKITFKVFVLMFLLGTFIGFSQTLNQNASWPNGSWTLTGTYNTDPTALEADPTVSSSFAYDDDDAGNPSDDDIAAESPVIDLTDAFNAGETWLTITVDYVYRYLANDELVIQYWDADGTVWVNWGSNFDALGTTTSLTDDFCSGTPVTYSSDPLDIAGFSATQLSGFQYRISYDDDPNGSDWNYGFCFQSPTISSSVPPTCINPSGLSATVLTADTAELSWTAGDSETMWDVEVVDVTGGGSQTMTPTATGVGNPYTAMSLTEGNDYEFYVRADCDTDGVSDWVGPLAWSQLLPPPNDDCANAEALTVNPDFGCGVTTSGTIELATASPEDASACFGTEDDDVWYTFVATATEHRIELLNVANGTTDLYHSVWEGTCGSLTLVPDTCSDPNTSNPSGLTIGNTYYVRVYSWTSTAGQTSTFDICIGTTPSCLEPTDLAANPTSLTDVDITWTAGDSETEWTYEYGVSPYAQGGGGTSGTVMTDPTLSLSGLTSGETYDIYIQANCGGGDNSTYATLQWTQPVVGEACAAPLSGTVETDCSVATPLSLDFTSGGSETLPSCDLFGNVGYWVEVTAPANGAINVNLGGSATSVGLAIFDSCGGSEIFCANNDLGALTELTGLTPSANYYMYFWQDTANGVAEVCFEEATCASATVSIPADPIDFTNCPATVDVSISIDDMGDSALLTISAMDDMSNPIGTGGDVTGPGVFTITNIPVPQTSFSITVAHESDTSCDVVLGPFILDCPPANDNIAAAVAVTVDEAFCDGTNTNGTNDYASDSAEAVGSCFNGAAADNDVWFTFTVPATTASVDVSTDFTGGTLVDTEIAVYSGMPGSLTELDCSQDDGVVTLSNGQSWNSLITDLAVTAGETYYVQVAGYGTTDTGTFCLDVSTNQTLGLNDLEEGAFTYYPNPVKNTLTLNAQNNIENVSVFNMLGQEVLKTSPNNVDSELDMSNLDSGAYFVKVTIANSTKTIRVIKQ